MTFPNSFPLAQNIVAEDFGNVALLYRPVVLATDREDPLTGDVLSPLEQDLRWCAVNWVGAGVEPSEWNNDSADVFANVSPGSVSVNIARLAQADERLPEATSLLLAARVLEAGIPPEIDVAAARALILRQHQAVINFHNTLRACSKRKEPWDETTIFSVSAPDEAVLILEDQATRMAAASSLANEIVSSFKESSTSLSSTFCQRASFLSLAAAFPSMTALHEKLPVFSSDWTEPSKIGPPTSTVLGDIHAYQQDSLKMKVAVVTILKNDFGPRLMEALIEGLSYSHRQRLKLVDHLMNRVVDRVAEDLGAKTPIGNLPAKWLLRGAAIKAEAGGDMALVASWPVAKQALWAAASLLVPVNKEEQVAKFAESGQISKTWVRLDNPVLLLKAIQDGVLNAKELGPILGSWPLDDEGQKFAHAVCARVRKGLAGDHASPDFQALTGKRWEGYDRKLLSFAEPGLSSSADEDAKATAALWCLLGQELGWDSFPATPKALKENVLDQLPSVAAFYSDCAARSARMWNDLSLAASTSGTLASSVEPVRIKPSLKTPNEASLPNVSEISKPKI
jgi:hypothetical protein